MPPEVAITSPGDGSGFTEGDPVGFDGTAEDTEDGDLASSLTWTSSFDGPIGAGGSHMTNSLSLGTHIITTTVADSEGHPGSDSISIIIIEKGSSSLSPEVTITGPPSNRVPEVDAGADQTIMLPTNSAFLVASVADALARVRKSIEHLP